ncbi:MAG: flagellar basal body-associated FliL family protein [Proteobacteria bacterium]|nr:flagellar basal body-associated FliL family protein [Pseudomonadota bacterium]
MANRLKQDDELSLHIEEPNDEKGIKKGAKALFRNRYVLIALIVLVLGGSAAGWFLFIKAKDKSPEIVVNQAEKRQPIIRSPMLFRDIIDLGSFEVRLGDMGGDLSFKIRIELDVDSPDLGREISRRSAQIERSIKALMINKTYNEIQGTDGKIILKNELIASLNRMLQTGKVRNIYFSEFIII